MSPYELTMAGGNIDYFTHNADPGIVWLQRLKSRLPRAVWLNPEPRMHWDITSNQLVRSVFKDMFPLSVEGLTEAVSRLLQLARVGG
jgi:uncharacterized protein with von Willebrand factor type A (vWA) domain